MAKLPMHERSTCERGIRGRLAVVCESGGRSDNATGRIIRELARGLTNKGWSVTIFHRGVAEALDGVEMVALAGDSTKRGLVFRVAAAIRFAAAVSWRLNACDGRFTGTLMTTNPPVLALLAPLLSRRPYTLLVHDLYPEMLYALGVVRPIAPVRSVLNAMANWSSRRARAVIVLGRDMQQIVQRRCGGRTPGIHVIPNWPDKCMIPADAPEVPRPLRPLDRDLFLVQYSGNFGYTHDFEPLLLAAVELASEGFVFNLIGKGSLLEHWRRRIGELCLRNVHLLDPVPAARLAEVVSAPHLSVVTLRRDCTGLSVPSKLYGLMAAGQPILGIVTAESEVGLVLQETGCGVVIDPPVPTAIIESLRRLRREPGTLARMAEAGRRAARECFSESTAVDRYDEVLQAVFSASAASSRS